MYQSLLLRPGGSLEKLPTLGFVMALSIRAALLRLAAVPPETVQVKWPNDLMVDDDKIAGISMEATSGGVCIGMGVNVFKPDETAEILSDSRYQPAYFEDMAVGYSEMGQISFGNGYTFSNKQDAIDAVGNAILSAFDQCYPVWQEKGFEPFLKEYESCSYLQGKIVRMQLLSGDVIVEEFCPGTEISVDAFIVETQAQADFLRWIGCTKIQGYYYCKPIPYEEIAERYRKGIQIGYES